MQAQEAESKGDPGAETELLEGPRRRRKEMGDGVLDKEQRDGVSPVRFHYYG